MPPSTLITINKSCKVTSFDRLRRWSTDDHAAAFQAFRRSANAAPFQQANFAASFAGQPQDWMHVTEIACSTVSEAAPRKFFEDHFLPCQIIDTERPEGLFTGYYEPELQGSREFSDAYPAPVLRKPSDLVAFTHQEQQQTGLAYGRRTTTGAVAFEDRRAIEQGSLANQGLEICWLSSWIDAFFLHVQGSGRVTLQDGSMIRLSYAAKSGLPYQAIGGILVERGILTRQTMSMQSLRQWMQQHPAEAHELMWKNPSYIFFRELEMVDGNLGAVGAGKVNLTPHRSLAIDKQHFLYGTPIWLETQLPPEAAGGAEPFEHLMIAQDTGSAIRGLARGDVYWGWGDTAAQVAGHMKSSGTMTILLPHAVIKRLQLLAMGSPL